MALRRQRSFRNFSRGAFALAGTALGQFLAVVGADKIGAFVVGELDEISGLALGAGLVDELLVGSEVALGITRAAVERIAAAVFADSNFTTALGAGHVEKIL